MGNRDTACAPATFGSATLTAGPVTTNSVPRTQREIIDALTDNGRQLEGTFDQTIARDIALLNTDPVWNYEITVKRINNIRDAPVFTLPAPTVTYQGNVKLTVYRPYNFRTADIAAALRRVNDAPGRVGVGMGGVSYGANNAVTGAHMFTPIAIESGGHQEYNSFSHRYETRHDFKIYDPYFASDSDIKIAFDSSGRPRANIWKNPTTGNPWWFELEELVIIEKVPRVGGGVVRVVPLPITTQPGPGTPGGSGSRPAPPVHHGPITPNPVCGNRVVEYAEECDDGNRISGDGCSSACRREYCGDGVIQTGLGEQCERDSQCPNYPHACSSCRCIDVPPPPKIINGMCLALL